MVIYFFYLNKKKKKLANMDAEIEQVYLFSKVFVETFQKVHAGK